MHALIVVSHPESGSLTHQVAAAIAKGITEVGTAHTSEVADLAAEGFDPRYNLADLALFRNQGAVPADVVTEQARVDRADALVLVFPVYWWSFPATLKGWIDRVFTGGWAYGGTNGGLLQRLPVHLVGLGASGKPTYDKHGYTTAMKAQIEHGIFDYCGARVASSHLLTEADEGFPQGHFDTANRIGREVFGQ
ncbi:TPA: NAD(P)H-dependent oxidoreductase [Citrobacter farmeri]|uniref:NAD(P)H-dependent oxidoreductase n=1 Tax=Citrobacter farmeri TaxID=67824 RepID=A0A8H9TTM5_9ENTR|nr:NAD(P)H-dependent oxidoreductase [Citrobacter farmeri]NTY15640.1 NAD(P)H-dependent oxidoreductase [Citrobacter farmeri]HAT1583722.1 NAD(P)H-dependent oxidoreductase [Citrobacter farmeri]HCB1455851.1 NAD(P)H-dependent oxidoreductase [Citrobacter farmeri]HCB1606590.1 NAD(P)H-dependent oxidoreductase [Citrobacter farmeri]